MRPTFIPFQAPSPQRFDHCSSLPVLHSEASGEMKKNGMGERGRAGCGESSSPSEIPFPTPSPATPEPERQSGTCQTC